MHQPLLRKCYLSNSSSKEGEVVKDSSPLAQLLLDTSESEHETDGLVLRALSVALEEEGSPEPLLDRDAPEALVNLGSKNVACRAMSDEDGKSK